MSYNMSQYNDNQWDYIRYLINEHKKLLFECRTRKIFIKKLYEEQMNKEINFDNPTTFNEKINCFKLNYSDSKIKYWDLADKYKVRKFVKKKIGSKYLIPEYFAKKKIKVKDLEKLPNQFVLKTNNGSGTNYIVKDKSKEDLERLCYYMNDLTEIEYQYIWGEFHYEKIKPLIIAEKLLIDDKNEIPDDLKCFCFKDNDGRKRKVLYFERVIGDERYRIMFDENWQKINVKSKFKELKIDIKKPDNADEILNAIDKLSEDFNFVRVDMFLFKDNLYFGELTFTPTAGYLKFDDDKTDEEWGSWIGNL